MKIIFTVNGVPYEKLTDKEKAEYKENVMKRLEENGLKRVVKRG